jgi:phosphonate transport system substrate-binding protein
VGSGNQANSLLDLRDQRFASADIISTSGWLYPALWLKERGIVAKQFFAEHLVVGSHDRSIRAVASGYANAAAVHSLVYNHLVREDPEISRKTRIIQKSPAYGMPPLVVSPNIDPELREDLLSVLLGMHQDESGHSVLKDLNIEKFIIPEDTLYDDIRRSVRIWETP